MQNTEETKANFTPKAVDFFNTNLTDIVADFFTNNDVSALNDKINTFKEQYIELNKSIKSAPQASTDDIDSDLDLEKTQEQKPTSNEENTSNIQGTVAIKDISLDAEDSISNDQLLDLRSVILIRLKNLNNEQKIHLEKTLTTEFLKGLIKLLADEKTSNNNKIDQNIIFEHSGMGHINFDVRYKLSELLGDIQNEAITNKTPHLFERILSSITKNNTINLESIGEEIYPGIKINPRAYLHYHFIVKMLENNEGEVSVPINETLMNEASLKTFFEKQKFISAGIYPAYLDRDQDQIFKGISVDRRGMWTNFDKVIVKFQNNSHITLSGEEAYREYKTKIQNDIQSNKKNYYSNIKFLKQIKPLFDDHRLANLLKVDSPTEINNIIRDIESLKDAKIQFRINLSYKYDNGFYEEVFLFNREKVDVEYNNIEDQIDDIISFSKLSDDNYLALYKQSADSDTKPYHRELFNLYEGQLVEKVKSIKSLIEEKAKAEAIKKEEEQTKRTIEFIKENTSEALNFLKNYLDNPFDFDKNHYDQEDKCRKERDIILNIDRYSNLYQEQDDTYEKITKIKDLMSGFPLKYIDFGYVSNNKFNAIDYINAKKLENGGKIHYQSIKKLNHDLTSEFNGLVSQYEEKTSMIDMHYEWAQRSRTDIHGLLPFFPIGITASSLLTIFSIVPASITTPINIIILCAAAILSVYIMLLPERFPTAKLDSKQSESFDHPSIINLKDDVLSSRLKHLGIFCLLNAVAITVFYYFLPALAVTILISLIPSFANGYKGETLHRKRNALCNLEEKPNKIDYLQERLKGCSLFEIKEESIKNRSSYKYGERQWTDGYYNSNYDCDVVLNTSINLS